MENFCNNILCKFFAYVFEVELIHGNNGKHCLTRMQAQLLSDLLIPFTDFVILENYAY